MKEELQERKRLRLNVTIILATLVLSSLVSSVTDNPFYRSSNAQNITSIAPTPSTIANMSVYENSTYGIKIQYPSDWIYTEQGRTNIVAFIPSSSLNSILLNNIQNNTSKTSTNQTNIPPSVIIGFEFLPFHNIPLTAYNNMIINSLKQSPGFQFVASNATVLAGNPANMIQYTQGPLFTLAIYTIVGNQLYTIAYIVDSTQYLNYIPVVQQMVNSLVINSTACTENFC
jgi:hypothetical protein